jgi:hypothetical protein
MRMRMRKASRRSREDEAKVGNRNSLAGGLTPDVTWPMSMRGQMYNLKPVKMFRHWLSAFPSLPSSFFILDLLMMYQNRFVPD